MDLDEVDEEDDEQLEATKALIREAGSKSLTIKSLDLLARWPMAEIFPFLKMTLVWLILDHE